MDAISGLVTALGLFDAKQHPNMNPAAKKIYKTNLVWQATADEFAILSAIKPNLATSSAAFYSAGMALQTQKKLFDIDLQYAHLHPNHDNKMTVLGDEIGLIGDMSLIAGAIFSMIRDIFSESGFPSIVKFSEKFGTLNNLAGIGFTTLGISVTHSDLFKSNILHGSMLGHHQFYNLNSDKTRRSRQYFLHHLRTTSNIIKNLSLTRPHFGTAVHQPLRPDHILPLPGSSYHGTIVSPTSVQAPKRIPIPTTPLASPSPLKASPSISPSKQQREPVYPKKVMAPRSIGHVIKFGSKSIAPSDKMAPTSPVDNKLRNGARPVQLNGIETAIKLDGPKRRTPPVPPAQVKAPNGLVLQGTSPAPLAATPKITHAPASNGTRRHAPAVPPTEVKAPKGITVPGSLSSPVASTDSANNNDLNKTHRETVITRKGDKVLIQGYIEEGGNLKLVRTREISADQYDHPEKYTSGKPTPSPRHGGHVKDAQAHLYIESDGPLVGAKPPEAVTAPPKKPDQHSDATGGTPPSPAHITPSAWHPHQQALQNHAILASYNPSQPARSGGRSAGGAAGDRVRPWSGGAPGDVIVPSEGGTPTPRDRFLPPNDEASGVKAADLHRLVDRLDKLTAELRRSQDRPIAVDVHLDGKQISRAVTHHLNRSLASPGISNNLDHRAVGFPPGWRASSV